MAAWGNEKNNKVEFSTLQLHIMPQLTQTSLMTHLTELLSITVWDECFKRLESSIDALHTPTFVAVGNLSTNSPLLVPGCFWGQRNVGQTTGRRREGQWLVGQNDKIKHT